MLNNIIKFSLNNRLLVTALAAFILIYGAIIAINLPVDVFPNLNKPKVTIITESHGFAPEEVETLVTIPLETAMIGTTGVTRVRSSSGMGVSIIHVEFAWGTDPYRNRQLVNEKIQSVKNRLPEDISPALTPITSIMGEIQFLGLQQDNSKKLDLLELRTLADWVIRPQLLSIAGVSNVIVIGGGKKQYQIKINPEKLRLKNISLSQLVDNVKHLSENTTGGFVDREHKEFLIRVIGRATNKEDLENSNIGLHLGNPVLLKDVAEVKVAATPKRGDGSINAEDSVIMTIQKQPEASTLEVSNKIDQLVTKIESQLPQGAVLKKDLFKQSHFIESSINNVKEALRDGSIIVAIILFLFLLNFRSTFITLTAIPLSFAITVIVFKYFGLSVNTMTLGGLAIAIGELVDDAIVDVENVFRRLKQAKAKGENYNPLKIIYFASSEIRNSIVISTIIVILVFIPLFYLSGIEGKLFIPLGIAYIISIGASLLVSLTITPVLCSYLLPKAKVITHKEGRLIQSLKRFERNLLLRILDKPKVIIGASSLLLIGSLSLIPQMGRNFLPSFNEGTATIGLATWPGISLEESNNIGRKAEKLMLSIPEVKSTVRRTGRAEMDEHAEGVHWSEIDVDFHEKGRDREIVLKELREKLASIPNTYANIGQPISHRLDHLLSGVRAQIAIKIIGPDLSKLRRYGRQLEKKLKDIEGLVDLQLEQQVLTPQIKIHLYREDAAKYGINISDIVLLLEVALNGKSVGNIIDNQKIFDISMRFNELSRKDLNLLRETAIRVLPTGQVIRLKDVASVYESEGPNIINRENAQRRIIVQANSSGVPLDKLVKQVEEQIRTLNLDKEYFIKLGGQFESEKKASKLILILGFISLVGIIIVLYWHFGSLMMCAQVLTALPLALIGSIFAIFITEKILSVATLIAFITLCGIASRNGVMMISHYLHLIKHENMSFNKETIIKGSQERLIPVLMTALTAIFALMPILFSKGEPGKEILYPVAVVITGGLLSSTLLDIFVTPVIFYNYAKNACEKHIAKKSGKNL
ncbi:MAG: CusA/CzcA family heavy metal efflux RND transporter [Halobacteriovoraceae bacterium]|nr:CusA/CzcA family heavy metal efflux RND transporter [Halobacteriovoraceae bacterium]